MSVGLLFFLIIFFFLVLLAFFLQLSLALAPSLCWWWWWCWWCAGCAGGAWLWPWFRPWLWLPWLCYSHGYGCGQCRVHASGNACDYGYGCRAGCCSACDYSSDYGHGCGMPQLLLCSSFTFAKRPRLWSCLRQLILDQPAQIDNSAKTRSSMLPSTIFNSRFAANRFKTRLTYTGSVPAGIRADGAGATQAASFHRHSEDPGPSWGLDSIMPCRAIAATPGQA